MCVPAIGRDDEKQLEGIIMGYLTTVHDLISLLMKYSNGVSKSVM